jgi:hypothetical protein
VVSVHFQIHAVSYAFVFEVEYFGILSKDTYFHQKSHSIFFNGAPCVYEYKENSCFVVVIVSCVGDGKCIG